LAAATRTPVPAWLVSRLPAIKRYVEHYQEVLPVRAAWLAAACFARLAGGDPLGLARVRDELLARLLDQGLRAERDLPSFLRVAGHRDADRIRAVREKALGLHAAARAWVAHHPPTGRYVDLLFAFALARLGEGVAAKELVAVIRRGDPDPTVRSSSGGASPDVTNILTDAFEYRITQAAGGVPHTGPLPGAIYDQLAALKGAPAASKGNAAPPLNYSQPAYVIDRMREESRVLEPEDTRDPYGMFRADHRDNPLSRAVLELGAVRTPAKQAEMARRLLREGFPNHPAYLVQFEVLREVLRTAPRVGETFTADLVRLVPGVLRAMPATLPASTPGKAVAGTGLPPIDQTATKQGELVERAIFAAAHFGRSDLLRPVIDAYAGLVRERPEPARFHLINAAAGQVFRSLKRLGMRDELDRFLSLLRSEVGRGAAAGNLRNQYAGRVDQWAVALETLLNLAAGWLTLGLTDHALPIINEARAELLTEARRRIDRLARREALGAGADGIGDRTFAHLLRTYVGTLGHAEVGVGLPRILEVFERVPGEILENKWTGQTTYSRFHIWVAEQVVWALVSDEFALGPTARKWLDDDETLVRKRVHADLHRERHRAGT
ncbi:MAG TPA: hypothetical protein VD866_25020, partial [Urbifossiella sp.]|nr:hypothetical protein [Urbifossiella sp.]